MKLLAVLMLTALSLYCSAGSDCTVFNGMMEKILDPLVTPAEYADYLHPFVSDEETAMGLREVKQCFLNQKADTINKVKNLEDLILNSPFCAGV